MLNALVNRGEKKCIQMRFFSSFRNSSIVGRCHKVDYLCVFGQLLLPERPFFSHSRL